MSDSLVVEWLAIIAVALTGLGFVLMMVNFAAAFVAEGGMECVIRGLQWQIATLGIACLVLYGFGASFGVKSPWST